MLRHLYVFIPNSLGSYQKGLTCFVCSDSSPYRAADAQGFAFPSFLQLRVLQIVLATTRYSSINLVCSRLNRNYKLVVTLGGICWRQEHRLYRVVPQQAAIPICLKADTRQHSVHFVIISP